jgi:Heparinase II/III-like protein/Heparinase II/III N-terminus
MSTLSWRFNRLRAMSANEIGRRVIGSVKTRLDAIQFSVTKIVNNPNPELLTFARPLHQSMPWVKTWPKLDATQSTVGRAQSICAGTTTIFGEMYNIGLNPVWNRDPLSGKELPLSYGPLMNLRDPVRVGSIKHLWELNRHASISELAQAWVLTKDKKYVKKIELDIDTWIDQCPVGLGANWHSALEVALRLINWAIAWHLLELNYGQSCARKIFSSSLLTKWESSAHAHVNFIEKNYSYGSSANNHLFGELAGIFVASQTWDGWAKAQSWRLQSRIGLQEQLNQLVLEDGVGAEQSVAYLYEICDLMIFCILLGKANLTLFSQASVQRLGAAIDFLRVLQSHVDLPPHLGDCDDAHPIVLGMIENANETANKNNTQTAIQSLIASYDALKKTRTDRPTNKVRWLLGDSKNETKSRNQLESSNSTDKAKDVAKARWFPKGGYLVADQWTDQSELIKIVADAGRLGYLSIAAHGHADALSLCIYYAGIGALIDPGTFSYRPNDPWRDWFRGTRAHNCVTIDHQNQSIIRGPFLWSDHAKSKLESFEDDVNILNWQASHDGYRRLRDPVHHKRTLSWQKQGSVLTVHDDFICEAQHHFEWTWQCDPRWDCHFKDGVLNMRNGQFTIDIQLPFNVIGKLQTGEDECSGGWISTRLGSRVQAPRLSAQRIFTGSWRATTLINFGKS